MFRRKTTITRPDRDRLVEITRTKANKLRWAMFIDELRRGIDRARVVNHGRVSSRVVTMHSRVRLRDLADGREEIYTLVYPEEADLQAGRLSVLSPLGTVLLGARAGDVVSVAGAAGRRAIEIQKILYQPEAAVRRETCDRATEKS
jgi:regulator of nucleoside diphosphate kinase